jgi:hypothetical protein
MGDAQCAAARFLNSRAPPVSRQAGKRRLSLASSMELWERQNLEMQFVEFQNGIEAFRAMSAGSLDVLVTGAVISQYPAMGRGKVFLINVVEYATAQLWCHPDMGIEKISDLRKKGDDDYRNHRAHLSRYGIAQEWRKSQRRSSSTSEFKTQWLPSFPRRYPQSRYGYRTIIWSRKEPRAPGCWWMLPHTFPPRQSSWLGGAARVSTSRSCHDRTHAVQHIASVFDDLIGAFGTQHILTAPETVHDTELRIIPTRWADAGVRP